MALTADTIRPDEERSVAAHPVENAAVLFAGSVAAFNTATGEVEPLDGTTGNEYLGVALHPATGNLAGTVDASLDLRGRVLTGVAVTGYTSQAQFLQPVYATDDDTFTLTRPATLAKQVGFALGFRSAGVGDVLLLTPVEAALARATGSGRQRLNILQIPLANLASANLATSYVMHGHGRIVGLGFQTVIPTTDADASAAIDAEIGGVNATGTLTIGDTADAIPGPGDASVRGAVQRVAVTANNEYSDGSLLDIECVVASAHADGEVILYIEVEPH